MNHPFMRSSLEVFTIAKFKALKIEVKVKVGNYLINMPKPLTKKIRA